MLAILFLSAGCAAPATPLASTTATPVPLRPGQQAFEATCASCHQASGAGVPETFPPLAGSEWVQTPSPEAAIAVVLRGVQGPLRVQWMTYQGSMPPHRELLKDAQISEILTYVRSSWGNQAAAVTPAQVAGVRKRYGAGQPWSEAELSKLFFSTKRR